MYCFLKIDRFDFNLLIVFDVFIIVVEMNGLLYGCNWVVFLCKVMFFGENKNY